MIDYFMHSPITGFIIVGCLIPIAWKILDWSEPHRGNADEK